MTTETRTKLRDAGFQLVGCHWKLNPQQLEFVTEGLTQLYFDGRDCYETKPERVEDWFRIRADGRIDLLCNFKLVNWKGKRFPVQFGETSGLFELVDCVELESLEGFPRMCKSFGYRDLINVPEWQMKILTEWETYVEWGKSDLTLAEFNLRRRGFIKGKKFEI